MGGALIQLVAYGVQDVYLTGNPNMSFFKVVYRRHTNFAIGSKRQTPANQTSLSGTTDTEMNYVIHRDGDLLSRLWLDVHFNVTNTTIGDNGTYLNWCNNTGAAYVKECEFLIGGNIIDKYNSLWLDVSNELYDKDEKQHLLLNKHPSLSYRNTDCSDLQLGINLPFWFNSPGLSLPLIALQYHECELKLTLRNPLNLIISDAAQSSIVITPTATLWADYIILDTEERRRFAQNPHDYLIEQHIFYESNISPLSKNNDLNMNHPIKELIWVMTHDTRTTEIDIRSNPADPAKFRPLLLDKDGTSAIAGVETVGGNDYFNYQMTSDAPANFIQSSQSGSSVYGSRASEHFDTAHIVLDGHDRVPPRKAYYYRLQQPLQNGHRIPKKHIYCYSFALYPEDKEPSGTCNFSRISTATLEFETISQDTNRTLNVFSINYNVLRISSGQGGLVFAN